MEKQGIIEELKNGYKKILDFTEFIYGDKGDDNILELLCFVISKSYLDDISVKYKEVSSIDRGPAGYCYTYMIYWIENNKLNEIFCQSDIDGVFRIEPSKK